MGLLTYLKEPTEDLPPVPKPAVHTVIAKDVTVRGTISGEGAVEIEGTVEGEITLNGAVTITPTGVVKGPVTADTVRTAGTILGNVDAREHLRLSGTGVIEGDIKTPSLVVEDGGCLNGHTTMVKKKKPEMPNAGGPPLSDLQFGSNYNPEDAAGE